MQAMIEKIASDYGLKRGSGKYVGPCPECGGSGTSDRFNIRDDGGFKCYSCDFKGDFISWLRNKEGMSCPEAHEAAGKTCVNTGCPMRDKCRMGDGKAHGSYRPSSVAPKTTKTRRLPQVTEQQPAERWTSWATALLATAQKQLQGRADDLAWLASRGIDGDAVKRFGLGWLARSSKVDREANGIPPAVDGKKHLWVPAGLVIPIFDAAGTVHRLRVRRSQAERERFLPNLKYVWLQGAGNAPMVLRPESGRIRGAVIDEAELDAYACAAAHDQILVVSLGTVMAGLPDALRDELAGLPVILVSLDADPGKDGELGPGPKAIAAWQAEFRQARFWPVPEGKDPGEYAQRGGSLHDWIEAGLVPELPASTKLQDCNPVPECNSSGGAGVEPLTSKNAENGSILEKQDCADSGPENKTESEIMDDLPAVAELVQLMSESGIRFLIKSGPDVDRLCVDWRGNDAWVTGNRKKARRLEDLIFRVDESVSVLGLLDDGIWDHGKLAWFSGY